MATQVPYVHAGPTQSDTNKHTLRPESVNKHKLRATHVLIHHTQSSIWRHTHKYCGLYGWTHKHTPWEGCNGMLINAKPLMWWSRWPEDEWHRADRYTSLLLSLSIFCPFFCYFVFLSFQDLPYSLYISLSSEFIFSLYQYFPASNFSISSSFITLPISLFSFFVTQSWYE